MPGGTHADFTPDEHSSSSPSPTILPPQVRTRQDLLPGSLRASAAKLLANSSSTSLAGHLATGANTRRVLGSVSEEHWVPPQEDFDDFEEISYDELPSSAAFESSPPAPARSSLLARSRSSLRKLSRISVTRPRQESSASPPPLQPPPSLLRTEEHALVLANPRSPASALQSSSSDAAPFVDSSSAFYDNDPFRKVESPTEHSSSKLRGSLQSVVAGRRPEPDQRRADTALSTQPRGVAPSSSSSTHTTTRGSIRRLKALTNFHLPSLSRKGAALVPQLEARGSATQSSAFPLAHNSQTHLDFLPDLTFEQVDFSPIFIDESYHDSPVNAQPDTPPSVNFLEESQPELLNYISHLQVIRYERVDPRDLTESVRTSTVIGFSPTATSLPPPSPSWLSRNVKDLEFYVEDPVVQITPPSPPPLPILPRSLLPVPSRYDSDSQSYTDSDAPGSPHSTGSSVTLYSPSRPVSIVRSPPCLRIRTSSTNRVSIISYRRSVAESRKAVRSFIAYSEYATEAAGPSQRSSLNVLFLSSEPSPGPQEQHPLTPILLFEHEPNHSPVTRPNASNLPGPTSLSYPILPSRRALQDPEQDQIPIPHHLLALARNSLRRQSLISPIESNMPFDAVNKQAGTVDYGEDFDYSGYEWFKDPPPPPPPVEQPVETYIPAPDVVTSNEMFDFALKSAPNVLYGRYKQYGQLGVLAWCSEFGEMIDALKQLGFEGNMFVSTRTQALKTCEDILKLKLKIDMQIIVMYLSSQVARLRRFLDADHQWDDYPELNFPLDPKAYSS